MGLRVGFLPRSPFITRTETLGTDQRQGQKIISLSCPEKPSRRDRILTGESMSGRLFRLNPSKCPAGHPGNAPYLQAMGA